MFENVYVVDGYVAKGICIIEEVERICIITYIEFEYTLIV
jgi:hypothetical protein